MIKSRGANGRASVTFTLEPAVGAARAAVCGDWNNWSPDRHVMRREPTGGFSLTIDLDAGRVYRFRYLLDGERWENDWAADAYVPNDFGGDDSLVDLTALAERVPTATGSGQPAAAKKAPVKKAAPAKKAAATKAAATKKAAPAKKAPTKAVKAARATKKSTKKSGQ